MPTTIPVAGSIDGVVPVYQPNQPWKEWALSEIFTGTLGTNRYVPKVNDWVKNLDTGEQYRVTAVDLSTLLSTMVPVKNPNIGNVLDQVDVLLGTGPGRGTDTFRVYIDKSVTPHTLTVDRRLFLYGSMAKYCQIVKGNPTNGTQQVISAMYDQSGKLLGQNIPLELVAMPNGVNHTLKTVAAAYTSQDLMDGEQVVYIVYNDAGGVESKGPLIVENTGYIRNTNASQKYVQSISLESPFMDPSLPNTLSYPINIPINSLNLFGVVHYSDGTTLKLPVDGTKFSMMGLDAYVATQVGQPLKLVLKYTLASNEVVYGASVNNDKFITVKYTLISQNRQGSYSVKLYCFPRWIDGVSGYTLDWFLLNLDRNVFYQVSGLVKYNSNYPAINPLNMGGLQRFSVTINLKDVNPAYKDFGFTQVFDVVFLAPATDTSQPNWRVGFNPGQTPKFGDNVWANYHVTNANLRTINLSSNMTTQADWLTAMVNNTVPLYDPNIELAPPTPNMFAILQPSGAWAEFNLAQWDTDLPLAETLTPFTNVYIKFFKRLPTGDQIISVAGLVIRPV